MKKYAISLLLFLLFGFGFFLIIRSGYETIDDLVTSFPTNYYRRIFGITITFVSFLLLSIQNILLIKKIK